MDVEQKEPKVLRDTVAYSLPRWLIDLVSRHAINERAKSKSHAAQDLLERGLVAYAEQKASEAA